MIPKHVEEKAKNKYPSTRFSNTGLVSMKDCYIEGAEYGYSLAMEEMKPILDAAREFVKLQNNWEDVRSWEALDKLELQLKQFDDNK